MSTNSNTQEAKEAPVAVKLQARSASIAAHSSNHATIRNPGFAWR
ncbi:MAG: hypothetical protein QM733_17490 [Ilumatobacteraceae bacterium]